MEGVRLLGVLIVVATLLVGLSAAFGRHGVHHLRELRDERARLARETFAQLERNATLREEIRQLRDDDLHLEALARRQLGLVRRGEVVYRFRRPSP